MKIVDNFLDQNEFDELHNIFMVHPFAWYYQDKNYNYAIDSSVDESDEPKFQFVHRFYDNGVPSSGLFDRLNPFMMKLKPLSLYKIRANLLTKTPNIIESRFHDDLSNLKNRDDLLFLSKEKKKQWTTSIFYVNTNNGYTEFEDGTKVESIANRIVTFPASTVHRGTSCTDQNIRVIINFNYFAY